MNLLTELKESLNISMRAVRGNKMRSVLTTLGIVIGIVSVTLMATAIEGVNRAFERSAAAFGTDVLYVQKFPWVGNEDWATIRNRRNLEVSYAAKIERQTTMIDAVAPVVGTRRRVSYGSNSMEDAFVSGTNHQYINASGTVLADGRFFSAEESDGRKAGLRDRREHRGEPLPQGGPDRKDHPVAGYPYTVVGVMEKQGGMFGMFTSDNRVFIPLFSFQSHFGGRRDVTIQVRVQDLKQMEDARMELEGVMRKVRNLAPGKANDFNINQQEILTADLRADQPGDRLHRAVHHRALAVRGRDRDHEHHVRVGDRADEGDRHPQGDRGQTAHHPVAVPGGSGGALSVRRTDRAGHRLPAEPYRGPVPADGHAAVGGVRLHRHLSGGGDRLGLPARLPCGKDGPCGGPPL